MSDTSAIHHDKSAHQFEVTVEGQRAYLAYMDLGKRTLDIYRTFVPDALRGRGIAASLAQHALDYAQREGYEVIASCSYVERYMDDLWRAEQRSEEGD
ncbi:N-acetyltransferase [Pseudomonas sp. ABC1]|uniref:GNAT family N-acetyltransferase n=1 Tax=Pseudomonas sp. ABC1 TaxID=2748080 RepID=UPI0015C3E167|nr:GNAT family N-acetyltransferase [Pseudomonas sp. ABC1]QLF94758.1 N-acetyltransferase [Pseudomonas sp. ABC1]